MGQGRDAPGPPFLFCGRDHAMRTEGSVVLLSGGQDSATCLAYALEVIGGEVHTLSFDYGQRHRSELKMSWRLSRLAQAKSHMVLKVPMFSALGDSALVSDGDVNARHRGNKNLPASFVPGRNFMFLGLAAALAYKLEINQLVTGVCQTDYSGYPDCRYSSITAIEAALNACLDYPIVIHTPLMWKTKKETVELMQSLGHMGWYFYTQTCYEGHRPPCGKCSACKIRARGFKQAGFKDPLLS